MLQVVQLEIECIFQTPFGRSRHRRGLLAWYDDPISTGPLEGTNNKIKTLKRQAYGFRDPEYFALKIKALHHTRFELVG